MFSIYNYPQGISLVSEFSRKPLIFVKRFIIILTSRPLFAGSPRIWYYIENDRPLVQNVKITR